jgi:DNA-binding response OmpR family regulator
MSEPKTTSLEGLDNVGASPTILIVEDDRSLSETLAYNLVKEGYGVLCARTGLEALAMNRAQQPELLLLDIMLPGIDGFEVCKAVRASSPVPIIMLTAKDDEIDRVLGLELGADDYVVKPFSLRELLARIRATLRRVEMSSAREIDKVIAHNGLLIDPRTRGVERNGVPIHLLPREFDLLLHLMRNRGIVLSRNQLVERVWGEEFYGEARTVDVHVRRLRTKIEPDPANPCFIRTMYGVGYTFDGSPGGAHDA